ncbi:MAG: S41 family peptidase [Firmicutes bacterium]|nr:S41 family peptidase [Bacillota bacterium]
MREEEKLAEKYEKKIWWRGFAAGAAACIALLLAISFFGQPSAFNVWKKGGITPKQAEAMVNKADALIRKLDENYLENLDDNELLDGAYHGLVSAVGDKYTRYYDEEEYQDYKESSNGRYVGIGVTVRLSETGGAEITIVEENGPAYEAGLAVGDVIVGADENDLTSLDLEKMVSFIKGEEGTQVKITYICAATGNKEVVDVTRRTIESKTVEGEILEEGIGYLRIVSFDGVTTDQFITTLDELKAENLQGLIIDLRDNPGGRLDVVNAIVDQILPAGIITYTEDKSGEQEIYYSTDDAVLDLPLVLLVNHNAASASEIMAGAIQDREAGILVGTTTYGKGIVQVTSSFDDGTAIKVTTSKYYTPNGSYIHQIGITPDIMIDLPEGLSFAALTSHEEDIQLQTALEALKTQMGR